MVPVSVLKLLFTVAFSTVAGLKASAAGQELKTPPGMEDCVSSFGAFNFNVLHFWRYDSYFRNTSVVHLPEGGKYLGPEDIEEYIRFATPTSPYINKEELISQTVEFRGVDPETGTCVFMIYRLIRFESNPDVVRDAKVLLGLGQKLYYDYHENYISLVRIFFANGWYNYFFGTLLNTEKTRDFICSVSESCNGTNVGMTRQECKQRLQALPILTQGRWFDGKDYGCRAFHGVFASINPKHCPHISFEPQKDRYDKIKCQESEMLEKQGLFDQEDIQGYVDFLSNTDVDPDLGYKILYMPRENNTVQQICLGLVVPVAIFLVTFFVKRRWESDKHNSDGDDDVPELLANKARRLWVIGLAWIAILFVANGAGALAVWGAAKRNPEWEWGEGSETSSRVDDMRVVYSGSPSIVSETVPQALLSDDQFVVYTGFIVWITCVIAGLGLEVFVWYHFVRVWCSEREGLWRFAQFIFPLLLVVALGLAIYRNFLALPVMVVGLWKFGFPETLMYIYLALYGTTINSIRRASDALNGVGTVMHHGAASMYISMLAVGVFPASRNVLSGCLILVMQHWVVLLTYVNTTLYSAIELVLEYYFEWTVFSEFQALYHQHWTAALGAGVMLFSHWLYLAAAVLELFDKDLFGSEGNVHERGQEIMGKKSNSGIRGSETKQEQQEQAHEQEEEQEPTHLTTNGFIADFHAKGHKSQIGCRNSRRTSLANSFLHQVSSEYLQVKKHPSVENQDYLEKEMITDIGVDM